MKKTMYRKVVRRPEHLQKNLGFHELLIGQHEGRFGRHKLQSSVAQIRCVCDHWMSLSPRPTHKDNSNANWWIMDTMVKEAIYAIYAKNKLCQTPVMAKRVTSSRHEVMNQLCNLNFCDLSTVSNIVRNFQFKILSSSIFRVSPGGCY